MTLGDRVAVMRKGVLQQVGSPQELYDTPANLFVAGFIGSPAMNFMPAEVDGGKVKLPMVEVDLSGEARAALEGQKGVIAGIRPENFEDASLTDKEGPRFTAEVDVVESMGSEIYAYFHAETGGIESDQLAELAEDAGTSEVPGGGGDSIVARLDPTSEATEGEQLELWMDATRLQFFEADSGERLAAAQD